MLPMPPNRLIAPVLLIDAPEPTSDAPTPPLPPLPPLPPVALPLVVEAPPPLPPPLPMPPNILIAEVLAMVGALPTREAPTPPVPPLPPLPPVALPLVAEAPPAPPPLPPMPPKSDRALLLMTAGLAPTKEP